jgi:hypothetical protein
MVINIEPTGLVDGEDVGCERKKSKDDLQEIRNAEK